MKKIITLLLSFLFVFSQSWVHANLENDISESAERLSIITNWSKYIKAIDSLLEKKKENEIFLNLLTNKLTSLEKKLKYRTDVRSKKLKLILNYLTLKTSYTLAALKSEQAIIIKDNEITEDEKIIEEKEMTVYPGFSDSYNEEEKTLLAWEEVFIYKQSFSSLYEASDVGKVIFYISGPEDLTDIKSSIETATLYLEWSVIDSVWSSKLDIISSTQAKITFDNLNDFIITQNIRQARLKIKTAPIGREKAGKTIKDIYVSKVWFDDVKGISSGNDIAMYTVTEPWELFSIVPGVLEVKVEQNLSSNIPELNIRAMFGNNTIENWNNSPTIELEKLRLSTLWSSWDADVVYSIYNSESSSNRVVWVMSGDVLEFNMSALLQTNRTLSNSTRGEDYKIVIAGTTSSTVITLNLVKSWIDYTILWITWSEDLHINMEDELDLWSKSY